MSNAVIMEMIVDCVVSPWSVRPLFSSSTRCLNMNGTLMFSNFEINSNPKASKTRIFTCLPVFGQMKSNIALKMYLPETLAAGPESTRCCSTAAATRAPSIELTLKASEVFFIRSSSIANSYEKVSNDLLTSTEQRRCWLKVRLEKSRRWISSIPFVFSTWWNFADDDLRKVLNGRLVIGDNRYW